MANSSIVARPNQTVWGHSPFALVSNLWRSRDILWYLIIRSLRSQYKKSALGYAWVFLNPLAQLLTLSFVFSTILKTPSQQGVPFTLFLLMGLVPWIFFSNCVAAATESISGGGSLITMVYFPREVLTASAVFARVVDLAAGIIILMITMVVVGQPLTIHALWLFPFLLVQILFTLGLVFPLAALNLYFHDVRFLVGVFLNLWFYLTPIVYPRELVPDRFGFIYDLNPMSRLISSYRWALFKDVSPPLDSFFFAALISIVAILLGYVMFKKMEHGFADNI